ncbi:MAG TPA: TolC family protein [Bryobacteraceae bacterium]
MKRFQKIIAVTCCAGTLWAQQQAITPQKPTGFIMIRPYKAASIPPVRLGNSTRLQSLVRAGKLYLTAQDAIALALENNIDLELDRYNPIIDQWNLERAEAGGALPGVPSGQTQSTQVASGQGAAGSQAAAGVSGGGGGNGGTNAVGATISQIGSVTPVLDPVIQSVNAFSHISTPSANTRQIGVVNWIQSKRNYTDSISQGLISGGEISLSFSNSYLDENVPSDFLNPTNGTTLELQLQHNLLRGFGVALNARNINVQKRNLQIDDTTFATEVMGAVANVLNLYYGLAADYEDVRAKQSAFEVAQRFFENNKKQVQVGTMAPIDVTTAEAQVASSQQDLVVSQTTLAQQEVQLKNVLSRNGLADPLLAEVQIVPIDRIVVPEKDSLPPMKQLVATALANRPDLQGQRLNLENLKTSALNTENGVLPRAVGLASTTQQGLAGAPRIVPIEGASGIIGGDAIPPGIIRCPPGIGQPGQFCIIPDKYFVGGVGNALGQMIRRNFPSESGGGFFSADMPNRQAQADYAIDQLSMRQSELGMRKDLNQVAVDVSNQMIGLQQARARYQAAVHNRTLQQQLLDAEQKKFSLGASTTFLVVQQQRDLATAQSAEVAALVAYSNARVALDQTLGTTLDVNHVSIDEARTGQVARRSTLPEKLPEQP